MKKNHVVALTMMILALSSCMTLTSGKEGNAQPALSEGQRLSLAKQKAKELKQLRDRDWNTIDWGAVLDKADEVIALDIENFDAWWAKGDAYDHFGKPRQTLEARIRCTELQPGRGDMFTHVALKYAELGYKDQALEFHLKAISIDPNGYWVWENYGRFCLHHMAWYEKAIEAFNKHFFLLSPGQGWGWNYRYRGEAYEKLGKIPEALADYRRMKERAVSDNDEGMLKEADRLIASLSK